MCIVRTQRQESSVVYRDERQMSRLAGLNKRFWRTLEGMDFSEITFSLRQDY